MSNDKIVFLKGIAIIVMLLQHWNSAVLRLTPGLNLDGLIYAIHWFTIPFGSQLFLMLSCVSLGRREPKSLGPSIGIRLKIHLLIIILTLLEISLVGLTQVNILTISPMMTWVICWSITLFVYYKFGTRGIFFLMALSFIAGPLIDLDLKNYLEAWALFRANFRHWAIALPVISFLGYAAQGILVGRFLKTNKKEISQKQWFLITGITLLPYALWLAFSGYTIDSSNLGTTRLESIETWFGRFATHSMTISILALSAAIPDLSGFKNKYLKNINYLYKGIIKVGMNSFFIFFTHRFVFFILIVVIKILMKLGYVTSMTNSLLESFVLVSLVLSICLFIAKKLKLQF